MAESAIECFRAACGIGEPLALECHDTGRPNSPSALFKIPCPFALVGRDADLDVVLPDPQVSKLHALFQVLNGRVYCHDLNSRRKLRWDGESEPRDKGWLEPGRKIWIGPHTVEWIVPDQAAEHLPGFADPLAPIPPETAAASVPSRAGLELPIRIGERKSFWRMESLMAIVGREEPSQLVVEDDSVSRLHASLIRTPRGVWVVDLKSREGVLVNGVRIRWAWLDDGDTVRIGRFSFVFRYEMPPPGMTRTLVPLDAGSLTVAQGRVLARRLSSPTRQDGTSLAVRPRTSVAPALPGRSSRVLTPVLVDPAEHSSSELPGVSSPPSLAMWQQQMQMMESFHNDMILMVQMFVAMHREHLVSVRDELDRVQKLTQELSVLQNKLAQADGLASEPAPPIVGEEPSAGPVEEVSPAKTPPAPTQSAGKPRKPPVEKSGAASGKRPPKPTDQGLPSNDPMELHNALTRRISELQGERQGYWQRILNAINK